MEEYFEDMDEWEDSFSCSNCGEIDPNEFIYQRTVANGEVWCCKNCKTETLVNDQPNEDDY